MSNYALLVAGLVAITAAANCATRSRAMLTGTTPIGRLIVAADSSTRFPTISAAVDSARDGDTIFVTPGVYREVVKLLKVRRITVLGADPATTIVDATGQYSAVEIRTDSNRVSCLTLRNADSHGIWIRDGWQLIDRCLIAGNGDRGIYLSAFAGHAYASISHCTIVDNHEVGIHAARDDSSTTITDCIIAFNARGVVTDQPEGKMLVRRNCLFGNGLDFDRVIPGDSNVTADPRFVSRPSGDYRLKKNSPCTGSDGKQLRHGAL